jgi:hypothetical protein
LQALRICIVALSSQTSKVLETFEVFGGRTEALSSQTSKVLETFEVFGGRTEAIWLGQMGNLFNHRE